MSTKRGEPFQTLFPGTVTIGAAAGRVFALGNAVWAILLGARIQISTTATVTNRQLLFTFTDPAGNIIFRGYSTTLETPSSTFFYILGVLPTLANNGVVSIPCPLDLLLPPGSSCVISDANNVDVNDLISAADFTLST